MGRGRGRARWLPATIGAFAAAQGDRRSLNGPDSGRRLRQGRTAIPTSPRMEGPREAASQDRDSKAASQLARHRAGARAQEPGRSASPGPGTEFTLRAEGRKCVLTCPTQNHLVNVSFPEPALCRLLATCRHLAVQAFCAAGRLNHSLRGCISFPFKCSYLKQIYF